MMYRIVKVLNHNTFIGIRSKDKCKCLIMGKGIAFGRKVSESISVGEDAKVYTLTELTERGSAEEIIRSVPPECLELAGEILDHAEKVFGQIDRSILFPMQITLLLLYSVSETRNRLVILLRRIYGSCSIRNTRLPMCRTASQGKASCGN